MKAILTLLLASTLALPAYVKAQTADDFLNAWCLPGPNKDTCEVQKKAFRKDLPLAYKGNYQSQRNVAYCLMTGCNGALTPRPTLACAWQKVIIASGNANVSSIDFANYSDACDKLTKIEMIAASAQSQKIEEKLASK